MKKEKIKTNEMIEKEKKKTEMLEGEIAKRDAKKDEERENFESKHAEYLKIRDEPQRLQKGNENLNIAKNHLQTELDNLNREISEVSEKIKSEKEIEEKHD